MPGGMEAKQPSLAAQQSKGLFQLTGILETPPHYGEVLFLLH